MFAFCSPWKREETRGEMGYYVQVQVWWSDGLLYFVFISSMTEVPIT